MRLVKRINLFQDDGSLQLATHHQPKVNHVLQVEISHQPLDDLALQVAGRRQPKDNEAL